jgi:hypothetical protein
MTFGTYVLIAAGIVGFAIVICTALDNMRARR